LPGTDRLAAALAAAVSEAGALALTTFRQPLRHWTKGHASPVSEADLAVDALLRRRLAAAAPDAGWLSEESEDEPARLAALRVWVVDPIDGTRAYLAGFTDWSISAALVADGRPVLAALFVPAEDALFLAAAGGGATLNGAPIAATTGTGLTGLRVAGPKRELDRLQAKGLAPQALPRIHSLALRLARVAQGTIDGAFAAGASHDWDLAAADLLVHEAGGVLTTAEGQALTYNQPDPVHGPLIAAGRARHARLLGVMGTRPGVQQAD
jgi:myo-inositol-1(or 4)-monophosphatase